MEMQNGLKTRILESLRSMDKLLYFIDDNYAVYGFNNIVETNESSSFYWKDQAVEYYENMVAVANKAFFEFTNDDEVIIKSNYIRLKRLLADLQISADDMEQEIKNYSSVQLEQLNVQITAYNIMQDLSMGKNLLKKPESLKDFIFYVLEMDRPSGNYSI